MSENTESKERLARPLIRLAKLVGIGTSYVGMSHDYHEIDDDVLIEILSALGIEARNDDRQKEAIHRILKERHSRLVAPTVLHTVGEEDRLLVNTGIMEIPSASIILENGESYEGTIGVGPGDGSPAFDLDGNFVSTASLIIPADVPVGYHTAAEPVSPLTPSPYLPVSRRLVNFTYIRPESVPEYATLPTDAKNEVDGLHSDVEPLNGDAQVIDRDAMWRSKMHALWIIFKAGRTAERQAAFDQFKTDFGSDLEAYATWCLCYDKWGAPSAQGDNWEQALGRDSQQIADLKRQFPDTLDFYRWLEWVASDQLAAAQQAAKDAGMEIGIMSDMAVGVHPLGADVWWNPERFAKGATVGAPPDMFNQQGQNWSQPPLSPLDLEATGYQTYRNMVHGMFARAGAVRIDHILGLFRLWWIPENHSATDGAYVHYDSNIMLGILAIEASRANGVVVGEDLGVMPDYVADSLSGHGILGCAVEWFEQRDGVFRTPSQWRPYALASVNTHDLPPAAGYLEYEHVKIRERLGLLTGPAEEFQASARAEQDAMIAMLVDQGYLDADFAEHREEHEADIIDALYRALKGSPCKLLAASITDAVGEKRAQNQPGTNNEYPNWRIPLADDKGNVVPLETLFDTPGAQRFAQIFNN